MIADLQHGRAVAQEVAQERRSPPSGSSRGGTARRCTVPARTAEVNPPHVGRGRGHLPGRRRNERGSCARSRSRCRRDPVEQRVVADRGRPRSSRRAAARLAPSVASRRRDRGRRPGRGPRCASVLARPSWPAAACPGRSRGAGRPAATCSVSASSSPRGAQVGHRRRRTRRRPAGRCGRRWPRSSGSLGDQHGCAPHSSSARRTESRLPMP